jgi:hypothetical protein
MNSKSKVPCIPINGTISWEDWLKKLFKGERGLPFTPTEKL